MNGVVSRAVVVLALSSLLPSPVFLHADRSMFSKANSIEEVDRRIEKLGDSGHSRARAILWSDKGTLLYRQGRMVEAAEAFEQALTHRTNRRLRRHIYLFMGKAYESHGRIDKAIASYEEALRFDDKNWRRHRDLGGLYEQVKLLRKARDLYQSARNLNPREPSLWYVTARIYRKMGLFIEAEPFLKKADELGHDENVVRKERSLIREGRGRYSEALDAWVQGAGMSADPSDIARSIYLAIKAGNDAVAVDNLKRLKAAGASRETVELYENLIELAPSGPNPLLSFRGKYPEIEALVTAFLSRERTP